MAQVTLYLDEETSRRAREAAAASGRSMSQWVAEAIRSRIGAEWPADVRALAGCWPDLPTAQELRGDSANDAVREPL